MIARSVTLVMPLNGSQLVKNRLSDNVGGVKQFSVTLQHALVEERHFALDENCRSNQGSLAIKVQARTLRSDPCISSVSTAIMITTSNSSVKRSGTPNQLLGARVHNYSVLECTPSRFPGCPACEPNLFHCG